MMKKLSVYGGIMAVLVLIFWLSTRSGMQADPRTSIPEEQVKSITLQSRHFQKRVHITERNDIARLTEVLNRLTTANGVWVEDEKLFPKRGKDWELEWLSSQGERLALVEIDERRRVFRGEYLFNFLGGDVFDMDDLTALLMGLPGDPDPYPTCTPQALPPEN